MFKKIMVLALFSSVLIPVQAFATKTVSSTSVEKGKFKFENKGQFKLDNDSDDKWEHSVELEYGATDRLALKIGGEVEKVENDDLEYKASEIKAKYKLTGEDYYLRSSVEVGYEMNHSGSNDDVGVELQMQKKYGPWDQRFNIGLDHEVGSDSESGVELGLEAGSYYKFTDYKVGLEYFGDFGKLKDDLSYSEQSHLLGSSITFDLPIANQDVEMQFGYLAGISDAAADHNFKYIVKVSF